MVFILQNQHFFNDNVAALEFLLHRVRLVLGNVHRLFHLVGEFLQNNGKLLKLDDDRIPALQEPVLPG